MIDEYTSSEERWAKKWLEVEESCFFVLPNWWVKDEETGILRTFIMHPCPASATNRYRLALTIEPLTNQYRVEATQPNHPRGRNVLFRRPGYFDTLEAAMEYAKSIACDYILSMQEAHKFQKESEK